MRRHLITFSRSDVGLTMVEYAVAGALVAIGAATLFTDLGAAIVARINLITTAITG